MTRVLAAVLLAMWSVLCMSVGVGVGLTANQPDVCQTPARYEAHCTGETYGR